MAIYWAAKTPTQVIRYNWLPDLAKGDTLASASVSATGAVVDSSSFEQDAVLVMVSGGTAGQTATFTVSATTQEGEVLDETIYLPIIASAAQIADTARQYISFALRKIVGVGNEASADEFDDALEVLQGIIAEWRGIGADIGAPFPLVGDTVIYCPDYAVSALRYNLRVACVGLYGDEPTRADVMMAMRGKALVRNMNLPEEREATYF